MRITLDTNVLMSGHSPGSGEGRQLLLKIMRGGHRLVLSQTMLYELEEVLHYPRIRKLYGLTDAQVAAYLKTLSDVAELVALGPPVEIPLTDRDDWMVLRTAIDGNADVLCTNDGGFYKAPALAFCAQYDLRVMKTTGAIGASDSAVERLPWTGARYAAPWGVPNAYRLRCDFTSWKDF